MDLLLQKVRQPPWQYRALHDKDVADPRGPQLRPITQRAVCQPRRWKDTLHVSASFMYIHENSSWKYLTVNQAQAT